MKILNSLVSVFAFISVAIVTVSAHADENAIEYVERKTAEVLKIDRRQVDEWIEGRSSIAVVGAATLESDDASEIIGKRHQLAQIAIMNAKLRLSEKLGAILNASETMEMKGVADGKKEKATITTRSKIEFLSKHQILGTAVLLQGESYLNGEYVMAVSIVWSPELQKSAQTALVGNGMTATAEPGKYSLEEWIKTKINPALVVGPRQFVDDKGVRHFIGFASMPAAKLPTNVRAKGVIISRKGIQSACFALRSDVETQSLAENILKQTAVDDMEETEVSSTLNESICQRFHGAVPPVNALFENENGVDFIEVTHPLFPDIKMVVYACELIGDIPGINKKSKK